VPNDTSSRMVPLTHKANAGASNQSYSTVLSTGHTLWLSHTFAKRIFVLSHNFSAELHKVWLKRCPSLVSRGMSGSAGPVGSGMADC
jgi:hypothetical protein